MIFKSLSPPSAIPTSVTTIYTVPANTTTLLKELAICNTRSSDINVRVFLVPSGGSPATSNALVYDFAVPSNLPFVLGPLNTAMNAGATLRVQANVTGLTIISSGVEIT